MSCAIEQALYYRAAGQLPRLHGRSGGFVESWQAEVADILLGFGDRLTGIPCPAAIFAQPLGKDRVAVVQVADQPTYNGQPPLGFNVLVLPRATYRECFCDPFAIAERFPPPWGQPSTTLATLPLPAQLVKSPTVADVRRVLTRVKAGALRDDEDPEAVELTVENAESPALLGGVQILVDGGKLVVVRPAPDPGLIRGLWTLLPATARSELWPATFAFGNALGFDALVVPRLGDENFDEYYTEEQAAQYPAGRYELSLQTAAESGDQAALDALFRRRSGREVLRLGIVLVVVLSMAVASLDYLVPKPTPPLHPAAALAPEQRERVAAVGAMAAVGNPWSTLAIYQTSRYRRAERAAVSAAIVANQDPFAAASAARAAFARYVEIWKPTK